MRVAAHPRLYDAQNDVPMLHGNKCSRCSRVYFPALGIGCEVCGATADQLDAVTLQACGVLHSLATVHLHPGEPAAPFTIAEVVLDSGPMIRAIALPGIQMKIGQKVAAQWLVCGTDDNGNQVVEPAFGPARNTRTTSSPSQGAASS